MTKGAEDHAESGRRFPLALAGMDDEQALLDRLGRENLVPRRLLLLHLLGVMGVELALGHIFHSAASFHSAINAES